MKLILFVLLLFFAGFAYLIVKVTNTEINDLRTHGASTNTTETENGVISGNVEIRSDTAASGGKFVYFDSSTQPLRTLYVSPTGSDSNPGTQTLPWKTFFKAAATAIAGDLVLFNDGKYTETQTTVVAHGGTAAQPIIFRSLNPRKAMIYYQNMAGKWRLDATGTPYIHIEDFEITGDNNIGSTGSDKFLNFFDGSDHAVVKNNYIHHIYEDLVKVYDSDNVLIDNNDLSDVTHEGIDIMRSISPVVRRNVITNANNEGIMIKGGTRNAEVYSNTILQTAGAQYVAISLGDSSDVPFTYDPSGYEAYYSVSYNNVVLAQNGATIAEALKIRGCDSCSQVNNVAIGADLAMVVEDGPGKAKGWNVDVHTRNPQFRNNIVMNCHKNAYWAYDLPTGTLSYDYNLVFSCLNATTPQQAHGVFTDPKFVDPLSDWHLQTGSPALGKGVTLAPIPTFTDANTPPSSPIDVSTNRAGTTRSVPWNIGAY